MITSVLAVAIAAVFVFKRPPVRLDESKRFNVVIIVADALRWDMSGCYGGEAATPHIDWLAENGTLFTNAYSTAPCTMPSAISMFTGNYSRTYALVINEITQNPTRKFIHFVNDNEVLLAEALRDAGYESRMDNENPLAASANNFQGFEPIGSALEYLDSLPEDQNFFLLKWFLDPHSPYDPAEKFKAKIPLDPGPLPEEEGFYSQSYVKDFNEARRTRELTEAEWAYIRRLYRAEVEGIDEQVGRILEALRKKNRLDKTLVVFTSDHGEYLGELGRLGHGHHYSETLVHVPLIFCGPGIPKGARERAVVSHLDLMPTLKELTGIRYGDRTQGESYAALFSGGSLPERPPYFDRISNNILAQDADSDALLGGRYKLIVDTQNGRDIPRLYDLIGDPAEIRDISSENPSITRRMHETILRLRKEIRERLRRNEAELGQDADLAAKWAKTRELLKSLGYIR